jgi:hypothetical protein
MKLQHKEMFERVIKVLRIEHADCKTDLEALEREKSITVLWKNHFENNNRDASDQISWIAALDRIIESVSSGQSSVGNKQLEQIKTEALFK